jgi:predicted nuclease of predicted toxin-antitoxin system
VLILRDALAVNASDIEVIAKVQNLDRILVSLNGDFSDIVAYPPATHQGIIAIQLHNHPEIVSEVMQRLNAFVKTHDEQEYYRGKLFLVEAHRIRVRT